MGKCNINEEFANYLPGWRQQAREARKMADLYRRSVAGSDPTVRGYADKQARDLEAVAHAIEMRVAYGELKSNGDPDGKLFLQPGPEELRFRLDLRNDEFIDTCKALGRVVYSDPESDGNDLTKLAKIKNMPRPIPPIDPVTRERILATPATR
jgi:hypothetical protein